MKVETNSYTYFPCLISRGLLEKPSLYLSDFLERNRGSYYDALTRVRVSNDLVHWVIFFLDAVIDTAEKSKQTFHQIMVMRNEFAEISGQIYSIADVDQAGIDVFRGVRVSVAN